MVAGAVGPGGVSQRSEKVGSKGLFKKERTGREFCVRIEGIPSKSIAEAKDRLGGYIVGLSKLQRGTVPERKGRLVDEIESIGLQVEPKRYTKPEKNEACLGMIE